MDTQIKADPFWENLSKLSVEEIDKRFELKPAAALKLKKRADGKIR